MEAVSKSADWDSSLDPSVLSKRTIRHEANELLRLADRLDNELRDAVLSLESCTGSVIVTGMGKAGLVGRKVSATLCSTGTKSYFLHAAEAIHGDLGRVSKQDHVLAFSMSGETEELTKILPSLRTMADKIVSVTAKRDNTLAKHSDVVIPLGPLKEADPNGLAPSSSTTAMMAIGDALAFSISERRGFQDTDFVRFHPGGSLGRKLTPVHDIMRPLAQCRVIEQSKTVRESCLTVRGTGRRSGAVMIVDSVGKLAGIFTDSDLARLLDKESTSSPERTAAERETSSLALPMSHVMTSNPRTIDADAMMPAAIEVLAQNQISELPVVDAEGRPVGLVDITDVIAWFPNGLPKNESVNEPRLLPFPPAKSNSDTTA